jgi:D-serine deaminase-like pyridoxal phosphate-dependent protein
MLLGELTTPALVVDAAALEHNINEMSAALPGPRLRPHVKAHKCTELARLQRAAGHTGFTCATIRECEGMASAGLGGDLLLANEVLDARRLGALVSGGSRVTLAVDSEETILAAAGGGVREVLVDVNVGLPRCGCRADAAPRLADLARAEGLAVRGVMGYEGHVVGVVATKEREEGCRTAMEILTKVAGKVGGEVVSGGGTGTYACNEWVTEVQGGSYLLMDTAYRRLGLPFLQAVHVLGSVISTNDSYAVADCGLKALGMDHGNPSIEGREVWFCSDEHVTFAPPTAVGDRVLVQPAHVDPTLAYHERLHLVGHLAEAASSGSPADAEVLDTFTIDLRGW